MLLQQPFAIPSSTSRVYYRTLTIDHTQVPSTQTNFPVLVSFTDATFKTVANSGHVKATNAFTFSSDSSGASLLKWEVERYSATSGEIVAWVKIASVSSASDTVFYIRYGGSITTDASDPTNVWTNSFQSVYHLKDGTTLSVADSTGLNNGTNHSVTAATGQIDGAGGFVSASSQYVDIPNLNLTAGAFTSSGWVNATSFPNAYNTMEGSTIVGAHATALFVKSTGKLACYVWTGTQPNYDGTGSHTLSTATWYLLHMTYDSTAGLIGYVNAASDGTAAANGALSTLAQTMIGQDAVTAGRFWNGTLDEIRFSTVARSADWITVEYANQKPSANLVALGSET